MNAIKRLLPASLAIAALLIPSTLRAQGTAFTYQGRLDDGGSPARGIYDLRFSLYDLASGGAQQGNTITNTATAVSNGLFTVTLDFGNQFPGADRWLEVGVRTNGGGAFSTLSPRQQLTAAPYAVQAANASSMAAANIAGTLALAQLPTTLITNSASGVNLSGTFSGNGATLTNLNGANLVSGSVGSAQLAAGTLASPLSAGGSSVQMQGNTVYSATNSAQTTYVLPINAQVGDVVRINGIGSGGWAVRTSTVGDTWTLQSGPVGGRIALSADATKLVAAAYGGQIYTSPDSGITWVPRESTRNWSSVASSADGTKLVAGVGGNNSSDLGQIYTSTDGGTNWTARESNRAWNCVASSADGTRLVAVVNSGQIYTSTDSGTNWTARASNQRWISVASAADGGKLVAVVGANGITGQIYTSTDSGTNWTAQSSAPTTNWLSVASSADGTKLVAVERLLSSPGQIYTSTDSGTNWMVQSSAPTTNWFSVASSADGARLVATVTGGQIYISTNSGLNWTARESVRSWAAVASSADGTRLAATATNQIYTSWSFIGTGVQGTSAEYQYLDNGTWQLATQPAGSVGTAQIADGAIVNADISASAAIAYSKLNLANNIVNADISPSAAIADTKLATISTAGKVANSALSASVSLLGQTIESAEITDGTIVDADVSPSAAIAYSKLSLANSVVSSDITDGTIVNADVSPGAAIADTKLATISTAGKVSDSALSANVALLNRTPQNFTGTNTFTGSVGIGTTTPGATLDIASPTQLSERLRLSGQEFYQSGNTSTQGLSLLLGVNRSANRQLWIADSARLASNSVNPVLRLMVIGNAAIDSIATDGQTALPLALGPNQVMMLNTNGNVGIGTATPGARLEVLAGVRNASLNVKGQQPGIGLINTNAGAHGWNFWSVGPSEAWTNGSLAFYDETAAAYRFGIDASGNVGIGTTSPTNKLHVVGGATFTSGAGGANQNVVWTPGSASWSFTSDRNTKDRVALVNPESVLDKVTRIPINEWSYIGYDQRHIGPMAQDFHAQFPLNANDKALNDADLHGVALAAIQGLNEKMEKENSALRTENADLKARLEKLETLMNQSLNGDAK